MIPFKRIAFNSHKMHNPSAHIVEGYFDDGSLMTYYIGIKGNNTGIEGMEYYTGTNYALPGTPAAKKPSFSRQFPVNKIPKKFKDNWEYLKKTYNEKYAQQNENTKLKETTKNQPSIQLSPSQVKLKNVLRPIVEGILKEEDGDFDQTEIQLARKLGTKLASELDYDGTLVGLAFLVALTDSNFHEERTKLVPLLSKVLGAKYKTSG